MAYLISLFIVLFKIASLFLFGYAFYIAKGWLGKTIVFLIFFFYSVLFIPIALVSYFDKSLKFDSEYIFEIDNHLRDIQSPLNKIADSAENLFEQILPNPLSKICLLILLATIGTMGFSHFIFSFIYILIVGSLWTLYYNLRSDNSEL